MIDLVKTIKEKEIVSFSFTINSNDIYLQIPSVDFKDSDSYIIKRNIAENMRIFDFIDNGQELLDAILSYGDIAYFPQKGIYVEINSKNRRKQNFKYVQKGNEGQNAYYNRFYVRGRNSVSANRTRI